MSGQQINDMALTGVRVVDFGQGAIDPLTSSYLADFGAECIKVENYNRLDFIRGIALMNDGKLDPDRNLTFNRYNQNKLSVLINLKSPKGIELAKKLVSVTDIVTENFTTGTFQRLGLGYEELKKVKPDIIMLSSNFAGQTGPYRHFRGQGSIIGAVQGLDEITGWPDRAPASPSAAFPDHYISWMWATVLLAALEYRRQTGKGQYIDGSSLEGGLDLMDTALIDYAVNKRVLTRRGNRHTSAAPHGVYRCQGEERWVAIAVTNDEEWRKFCQVLGEPAVATNAKYATLLDRRKNCEGVDQLIESWTINQTAEEVMNKLQQAGIAAGVVKNAKDLYEDPQLIYREHFWESPEEGMQGVTFEAPSALLNETPARFQRRGPFLGEHNSYVFQEVLGLSPQEYTKLEEEGVLS
jgi:benzylsuccinate CoA-transferase BbsF subunit